jgi:predicted ATPase
VAALEELVNAELVLRRGTPPHATYIFKHALVEDAAYASLLKGKRQQLHAAIARELGERFPEMCETQPELLAHHLTHAGLAERATDYWLKAGRREIERSAYLEAIAHLKRGLALLDELPDGPERSGWEYELQSALGSALVSTKGFAAPEVEAAYLKARQACRRMGEHSQLFTATWRLWLVYQQRCLFDTAKELLQELMVLAERTSDSALLLQAHHASWTTLGNLPDIAECWAHAEQGITLYEQDRHRDHKFLYGGHDPGVCCRFNGAVVLWQLGYPDRAARVADEAVRLAEELDHPVSLALALLFSSFVRHHRREAGLVRELAEKTITVCTDHGVLARILAAGHVMHGCAIAAEWRPRDGAAEIRRGLEAVRATRVDLRRPYYTSLLAEAYRCAGETTQGLDALAEALALIGKTGERRWEAESQRLWGELLLTQSLKSEAEIHFREALEVSRQQGAKSLELRTATSLARLWGERGDRQKAYDLLAQVYGWFTEGLDTPDLKAAKALLDAPAGATTPV